MQTLSGTVSATPVKTEPSRYVLYSQEYGVCLGRLAGAVKWSKHSTLFKYAPAFTLEEAEQFLFDHEDQIPDKRQLIEVVPDIATGYVSVEGCVQAGLPGW